VLVSRHYLAACTNRSTIIIKVV